MDSFKPKEVEKGLKHFGCYFMEYIEGGGSHQTRHSPITNAEFTVWFHNNENVRKGSLCMWLKNAGIDKKAFCRFLGKQL